MTNDHLSINFSSLSTALVADACMRLDLPVRVAPAGVRPLPAGSRVAGRVLPARHHGSVDVFLEAIGTAHPGDVLVVDNAGRMDEGPIGDLTALEARSAGVAGIVIWGCHRDSAELMEIGLPVFSYGAYPAGPRRLDARGDDVLAIARFGPHEVTRDDVVFADADGVVFAPLQHAGDVLATACGIWAAERRQSEAVRAGRTLREQFQFDEYLVKRNTDPGYSFRQHLRRVGCAIEE